MQIDPPDDLSRIKGTDPIVLKALAGAGITSFEQIASMDEDAVIELEKTLGVPGGSGSGTGSSRPANSPTTPTGTEPGAGRAGPGAIVCYRS